MTAAPQGYVTMAYGAPKFFEMAANLALSIRLNDAKRPITLIHKPDVAPAPHVAALFDRCVAFEDVARFPGVTIKLGIYEPTPYAEAFYVDADCLLMKPDMDRHWAKFGAGDFNIAGSKRTSGAVFGLDVEKMKQAAGVGYVVDANCGIVFFRKSEAGRAVFETARTFCDRRLPERKEDRPRRGDGLSDQPFFSVAMAQANITPVSYEPAEGTLMATTWRASDIDFDFDRGASTLKKPTGFRVLDRFWAKGWVAHDTTFAHFIEMKPERLYQRLSDQLRDRYGVPRYQFV
ncbi:MAG: hypothetical protein K2Q06_02450 [Parvularculaceae bacterium]|nr:hypothetical protein [Parvularculaceae bacterium]